MKVSIHVVRSAGSVSLSATVEVDLELPTTDELTLDTLMAALVTAAHRGISATEVAD